MSGHCGSCLGLGILCSGFDSNLRGGPRGGPPFLGLGCGPVWMRSGRDLGAASTGLGFSKGGGRCVWLWSLYSMP